MSVLITEKLAVRYRFLIARKSRILGPSKSCDFAGGVVRIAAAAAKNRAIWRTQPLWRSLWLRQ